MPDSREATPAMMNEITTPGPANRLAIRPATTYIPVPLHDPTPRDTRSLVVSSFFSDNSSPRSLDPAFDISFFLNQLLNLPSHLTSYLVHCCVKVANFSRQDILSIRIFSQLIPKLWRFRPPKYIAQDATRPLVVYRN